MILDFTNKWNPGDIISVSFLNGSDRLRKRVSEAAKQWVNFANIKFDFINNSNGVIRIRFNGGKNDNTCIQSVIFFLFSYTMRCVYWNYVRYL